LPLKQVPHQQVPSLSALDRKTLSALRAAPFDHKAASPGRHAFQETMSAFSFEIAGLKSSFGHNFPLLQYSLSRRIGGAGKVLYRAANGPKMQNNTDNPNR
jgi:hypothetical protein